MKRRPILSSRKKTSQLNPPSIKSTKAPTLFDHTTKIQQKLLKLKQQIEQKKKQTFHKTKTQINQSQTQIKLKQTNSFKVDTKQQINRNSIDVEKQLSYFLKGIGMDIYQKILCENGVDSMEILQEIKQKELQQIGVAKGHALKIIVNLKKQFQPRNKNSRKQLTSAEVNQQKYKPKTSQQTQKQSKQLQKSQKIDNKQQKPQPLQIIIQTDQTFTGQQQLAKRRYFCLYCYQISYNNFCNQDCEQLYKKMFEKYQKNLRKVQQLYGKKVQRVQQKQQQQIGQNQYISDLGFLDEAQNNQSFDKNSNNFDQNAYFQALNLIKTTNNQIRQQNIQNINQQTQQFNKEHQR